MLECPEEEHLSRPKAGRREHQCQRQSPACGVLGSPAGIRGARGWGALLQEEATWGSAPEGSGWKQRQRRGRTCRTKGSPHFLPSPVSTSSSESNCAGCLGATTLSAHPLLCASPPLLGPPGALVVSLSNPSPSSHVETHLSCVPFFPLELQGTRL